MMTASAKGRGRFLVKWLCATLCVLFPVWSLQAGGPEIRPTAIPKFKDYPVAVGMVRKAPLHLEKDDWMFRTRIRGTYKMGPNFAGHYAVSEVGCGTFCAFLLVVDVSTGKTVSFDVPSGEDLYVCDDRYLDSDGSLPGGIGEKFYYRPDSRLFVVTGKMPRNDCGARYFVEENGRMTQIRDVHLPQSKAIKP